MIEESDCDSLASSIVSGRGEQARPRLPKPSVEQDLRQAIIRKAANRMRHRFTRVNASGRIARLLGVAGRMGEHASIRQRG